MYWLRFSSWYTLPWNTARYFFLTLAARTLPDIIFCYHLFIIIWAVVFYLKTDKATVAQRPNKSHRVNWCWLGSGQWRTIIIIIVFSVNPTISYWWRPYFSFFLLLNRTGFFWVCLINYIEKFIYWDRLNYEGRTTGTRRYATHLHTMVIGYY